MSYSFNSKTLFNTYAAWVFFELSSVPFVHHNDN